MSIEEITAIAFHQGPAHEANQLIHDVRRQVREEQGQAVNFEVALMGRPFAHLQQEVAPRLALFLKSKRASHRAGFVSLFVGETLYVGRADRFFDVIRTSLGLDEQAFAGVLRRWQQTGRAASSLSPGQ